MKVKWQKVDYVEYLDLYGNRGEYNVVVEKRDAAKVPKRKDSMAFRLYEGATGTVSSHGESGNFNSEPVRHSRWNIYRGNVYRRGDAHLKKFAKEMALHPNVKRFILTPKKRLMPFRGKKHVFLPKRKSKRK